MEPDNPTKPNVKQPEVFKKINTENLLVIERGLLGDIPEKLRSHTRPNDLPLAKHLLSPHLNDIEKQTPNSPDLESGTPLEEELTLKKTFSFRDKFFRKSFFGKEKQGDKNKVNTDNTATNKEDVEKRSPQYKSSKEKDLEQKNKRSWFRKIKDDKEKKVDKPIYKRSKSFEFLPKALDEPQDLDSKNNKLKKNRHSFVYSSNDSLNDSSHLRADVIEENQEWSTIDENGKTKDYYLGDDGKGLRCQLNVNEISSSSTVNSTTNSSVQSDNNLFSTSFVELCDKFDKIVEYFNENYFSDCEPYTKPVKEKEINKEKVKRKSSSFTSLPSPKIVHRNSLKCVSHISEAFKKELSNVISNRPVPNVNVPLSCRTERRGSVTDWFVLDESSNNSSANYKNSASENNKYKRAQKKPVNRVRRISSTKYVSNDFKNNIILNKHDLVFL